MLSAAAHREQMAPCLPRSCLQPTAVPRGYAVAVQLLCSSLRAAACRGRSQATRGGSQVSCATIPLMHTGKLGGLTLQKQFHTAMEHNAKQTLDYLCAAGIFCLHCD